MKNLQTKSKNQNKIFYFINFLTTLMFSLIASYLLSSVAKVGNIFNVNSWEFQFVVFSVLLSIQFSLLKKSKILAVIISVVLALLNSILAVKCFYMLPFNSFIQYLIISVAMFAFFKFTVNIFWVKFKVKYLRVFGFTICNTIVYAGLFFALQAVFKIAQPHSAKLFFYRGFLMFLACSTGINFSVMLSKKIINFNIF